MRATRTPGEPPPTVPPTDPVCPRATPVRTGQTVVEYALVVAVLAIGCIASITFLRESFRTLYTAHQAPLNEPVSALAWTATPDEARITPTPTVTTTPLAATWTPIPTLTPTPTPLATATAVPTSLATMPPTATSAPSSAPIVPTPTTPPPTPTPEPVAEEPSLPDCADVPWWYRWFGWCS